MGTDGRSANSQAVRLLAAILIGLACLALGLLVGRQKHPPSGSAASQGRAILYYRDPMNPQVTSPVPKKDSMGMDYVPVYSDEATGGGPPPEAGPAAIRIDPRVIQNTGVTTERAEVRVLTRTIRTVGTIRYDERRLYTVTTRFGGWIDRLYVNFIGDRVRRGDPLATVYSPDLVSTEQEYLSALRLAGAVGAPAPAPALAQAQSLMNAARRRLLLVGLTEQQIDQLSRERQPRILLTVGAPASGVVVEKEVNAGSQVQPGMPLLRIAELSDVWVFAEVYPPDLPFLQVGQAARVSVAGLPAEPLQGRVDYIQPAVQQEARSVPVRIQLPQPGPGLPLKPNMFAEVEIASPVEPRGVAVPDQAIVRTGTRNVAIVALGNGYFEPREVQLGTVASGYVEILAGIHAGDEVVTSSQFLIDSESNLKAALGAMQGPHAALGVGGGSARATSSDAATPPPSESTPMPPMPGMQPGRPTDGGTDGEQGGAHTRASEAG